MDFCKLRDDRRGAGCEIRPPFHVTRLCPAPTNANPLTPYNLQCESTSKMIGSAYLVMSKSWKAIPLGSAQALVFLRP